jgi:hypothetical protein
MIHFTPEDLSSCGLSRKDDAWWEGAGRVLRTFALTGAAYVKGGPVAALKTAWNEAEKCASHSDYKRSDFHLDSCTSSFCRGCK